jgi:LysR family glycine cleavage system transcriptional activator
MAGFLTRQPSVSLHLSATTALIDFERERADLAIRYFDGLDPALQADLLYPDEARLYGAPDYIARLNLATPADLARATLLHTTLQPHWVEWLRAFSPLTTQEISSIPSVHFDQSMLAIEMARHGQGVVLSSPILVETELREGTLCEPWPHHLPVQKGYYVVHPRQATLRPSVQALKAWLLEVTTRERQPDDTPHPRDAHPTPFPLG